MAVALIADDRQVRLDTHADFLEFLNVKPLKALTISAAKKIVGEMPCVDFAIIDINFDPNLGGNREGLEYGRQLKLQGYPTYLAAYSAYYAEDDAVMAEVNTVFDSIIRRAPELEDYKSLISAARARKLEYLEKAELTRKSFMEQSVEHVMRFVELHDFKIANSKVLSDEYVAYIRAGYKIKLVEPTYRDMRVGRSFLLWSKQYEGGVFLEVYKIPTLFAYGETEEAALRMLNDIIVGLYNDAGRSTGEALLSSPDAWDFVRKVYEAA